VGATPFAEDLDPEASAGGGEAIGRYASPMVASTA
jgi:hypothetical protein